MRLRSRRGATRRFRARPSAGLWTLLLLLALPTLPSDVAAGSEPPTIGHAALKLEAQLGASSHDVRRLETLIDEARDRIPAVRRPAGRRFARRTLQRIDGLLRKRGLRARTSMLLHRALRDGLADCDLRVLLYVSIGQALELPVGAARVHGLGYPHLVVRYGNGQGGGLLWETLDGHVFQPLEGQRVVPLDPRQLLGLVHFNAGVEWGRRGAWDAAIASLDRALQLDRTSSLSHRARADVLLRRALTGPSAVADLRQAQRAIDRAIELAPTDSDSWVIRAVIRHHRLRKAGSFEDIRTAVRLDRGNPAAQYYLGLALLDRGKATAAIRAFTTTIRLGDASPDAYDRGLARYARYHRGLAFEHRARGSYPPTHDLRRATDDAVTFLRTHPEHRGARALMLRLRSRTGWNLEPRAP